MSLVADVCLLRERNPEEKEGRKSDEGFVEIAVAGGDTDRGTTGETSAGNEVVLGLPRAMNDPEVGLTVSTALRSASNLASSSSSLSNCANNASVSTDVRGEDDGNVARAGPAGDRVAHDQSLPPIRVWSSEELTDYYLPFALGEISRFGIGWDHSRSSGWCSFGLCWRQRR